MNLLIISFFYKPDLSAGSFRTTALVESFKKNYPDLKVDVISTLPNRYANYSEECKKIEFDGNVTIHRADVSTRFSGIFGQIISFVLFFFFTIKLILGKKYDIVYATSSRLMTAFLGAIVSTLVKAPLYLDIRDIFIDTIEDVFPKKMTFLVLPILSRIEKFTINKASIVNMVSKGFLPYFENKFKNKNYNFFTNGIDKIFLDQCEKNFSNQINNPLVIVYAGNFGDGQGLHKIIPLFAKKLEGQVIFKLIGNGGRKNELERSLNALNVNNVQLIPPVNRGELLQYYESADILFLHLNDYDAFKKVIPSKIFEYACYNKPILGGVSGYVVDFIGEELDSTYVFHPCDVDDAINKFREIDYSVSSRKNFIHKYARSNIMDNLANNIIKLGKVN
ncbi:glycosyltransferase family 4 protein [Acinetobacter junii]|uniref:glycosyltransferase family 4 protein n=1 Tax=Acinetobacter junii TaxID=40215 RepID=UPI001FB2CDB0|nr:glycosyltransferase family 4 protein [Acinetobacter junii]UOB52333.1 glycosyltransferase family 4 protein [Acinetobacter junii]